MALTDYVRHPILGVFLIHYINAAVESPREFTHLAISYIMLLGFQMVVFILFPVQTPEGWRTCKSPRNLSERVLASDRTSTGDDEDGSVRARRRADSIAPWDETPFSSGSEGRRRRID